ncbi:MAG: lysylphosphatidylglycerol synthase transmembrane domain-containing protein [Acidobacteriota bacterium]|nr:lysylphosphatidylglycerol synthase transmembrane domain-containing protein [Acidobacteriota bacterium]MDQ7086691.1 lysylphosphatidylglycerol synthase transmembrane domain-containing protein [Acidobacteriota bacterium]
MHAAPIEPADRRVRKRGPVGRRVLALTLLLLAVGFLAWQVQRAGPREIASRLVEVSWPWLGVIAALTLARYLVASMKLAAISRRLMRVRFAAYVPIFLASQILTLVIPGLRVGGTILRAHLANRRFGGGFARHLGPNILDQLTLFAAWLIAAGVLLPVAAAETAGPVPYRPFLLLAGLTGAFVGGFFLFRRHWPAIHRWLRFERRGLKARVAQALAQALEGTGTLVTDPTAIFLGLGGGLLFVLLAGLCQHAALHALGEPVAWWTSLLAVVVGTTAGTASGTPGGLGVAEAAQVVYLQGQGIPPGMATAAVLLARGAYYISILATGGLSFAWEARQGHLAGLMGGRLPAAAHDPVSRPQDMTS